MEFKIIFLCLKKSCIIVKRQRIDNLKNNSVAVNRRYRRTLTYHKGGVSF